MDKQQKLKIALPILFVVMGFVYGPILFSSDSKSKSSNVPKSANVSSADSGFGMDLSGLSYGSIQKKTRTAHETWGQNPFMLKRTPKAIYVEGIMYDDKSPKAIINGEILGIGDTIEGKLILDIKAKSVTVDGDAGEIVIQLHQ